MKTLELKRVVPESVGVSSDILLAFLKSFDDFRLNTHSILVAKGNDILTEAYYTPYCQTSLHRAYSVSKSFIAGAVGVAVTKGLFTLDDVILDYFPECKNDNTLDGLYERCTVRDMLKMSSNIASNVYWWGKFATRVEAYYTQNSVKFPGQIYCYDSIGCFLLGCIIQKLTGKDFLTYFKENCLLELGFSKDSYVLTEPGGFGVGDSGIMCTLRDFLIFARLLANGGSMGGKTYIDPAFVKDAVSPLIFNDLSGELDNHTAHGYGYLIRNTKEGFCFVGKGDQHMFYDAAHDVTFAIHSDNQDIAGSANIIYHFFQKHLVEKLNGEVLSQNKKAYEALTDYEASRKLMVQYGKTESALKEKINGVYYKTVLPNKLNLDGFCITFSDGGGHIDLSRNGSTCGFDFGLGENKFVPFSFGDRAKADMMGVNVSGEYDCAASGGFVDDMTLAIKLQVIDTFLGKLQITVGFSGNEASMYVAKAGQYIFDGMTGYILAKAEN